MEGIGLCPAGTGRWSVIFLLFFVVDGSGASASGFVLLLGRRRWWGLAVGSGRRDAAQGPLVEDQSGRAALETRVAALAGPVTVAGFPQWDVAVGVVFAQSCYDNNASVN